MVDTFNQIEEMDNVNPSVRVFKNLEFGNIRIIIRNGEPWFVGNDVSSALGYVIPKNAIRDNVEDEDKEVIQLSDIQDGPQGGLPDHMKGSRITIINESGLYSLIIASKLNSAKKFKRWVTSEVLPSIRKTGSYEKPKDNVPTFGSNPNPGSFEDTVRGTVVWIELVRSNLRLSDASALSLYTKAGDKLGLPVPDYVPSKGVKFSATFLLNKFGRKETIHDFNRKMEEKGFLETRTRPSLKGVKRFKSLTEKGMEFGENMVSPKNEKETRPHYYDDKFEALMSILFS